MLKTILIALVYIGLFLFLVLKITELLVFIELSANFIHNQSLATISKVHISLCAVVYIFLFINSFIELNKKSTLNKREIFFWKKILLLKPLSGITAYNSCISNKFKRSNILPIIKISYNLRNTSVYVSVLSILLIFLFDEPTNLLFVILIIGLFLAIIMHFIFEPLIIIYAWQNNNKKEWEELDYYSYFSSVKSILGYKKYYKNHIR